MMTGPTQEPAASYTVEAVAKSLDVTEATLREWLATFNWERHYDGGGHLLLAPRDVEFLRVIKSLKDVDRSCESIVRIISDEPLELEPEAPAEAAVEAPAAEPEEEAAEAPDPVETNLAQIATLKAELKELHAHPTKKKPFWKFW